MTTLRTPALALAATAAVAAPAAALAPTAGARATARAHAARAGLTDCDGHAVTAPSSYMIACGDGNTELTQLHWRHWGQPRATATGTEIVNLCRPNCATGRHARIAVRVDAERLSGGRYGSLVVHAGPHRPAGVPATQRFPLPTRHA